MKYNLANNVTRAQFDSSTHFVYAHVSGKDVYIGITKTLAKRWSEHKSTAVDPLDRDYTAPFKKAIRSGMAFEHFIIGAFTSEREARELEACAIQKFSTLNSRPEPVTKQIKMVDKIVSQGVVECIYKNANTKVYTASDRSFVHAKVIKEKGRLRLVSIGNGDFPRGLMVECSRSEREKFREGALVKVKALLANKKGKDYFSADKSAVIYPL